MIKLVALQDIWINGGSVLIKEGETFEMSCGNCIKNLVANGQAKYL